MTDWTGFSARFTAVSFLWLRDDLRASPAMMIDLIWTPDRDVPSRDHALLLLYLGWGQQDKEGRSSDGIEYFLVEKGRTSSRTATNQSLCVRSFASATCQGRKGKEICGNGMEWQMMITLGQVIRQKALATSSLAFSDRPSKRGIFSLSLSLLAW